MVLGGYTLLLAHFGPFLGGSSLVLGISACLAFFSLVVAHFHHFWWFWVTPLFSTHVNTNTSVLDTSTYSIWCKNDNQVLPLSVGSTCCA